MLKMLEIPYELSTFENMEKYIYKYLVCHVASTNISDINEIILNAKGKN